jgi:SAM-dependent methyltransferase
MNRGLSFAVNKARWDEVVALHVASPFYRVPDFLQGRKTLSGLEQRELGSVAGKSLVHLQCHFGLDTLTLARLGAEVTGLDFSEKALAAARDLAAKAGIEARFVLGNLYDAPALLGQRYEVAFVSWGAINWLPDIEGWARVVAAVLEPGGFLYMIEGHPCANMLDQKQPEDPVVPTYPYWHKPEPLIFEADVTYTGQEDKVEHSKMHEWIHPLSDIVNALLAAGLRLEFLNEHPRLAWKLFPSMVEDSVEEGFYVMPPGFPNIPLAFSLKAVKDR